MAIDRIANLNAHRRLMKDFENVNTQSPLGVNDLIWEENVVAWPRSRNGRSGINFALLWRRLVGVVIAIWLVSIGLVGVGRMAVGLMAIGLVAVRHLPMRRSRLCGAMARRDTATALGIVGYRLSPVPWEKRNGAARPTPVQSHDGGPAFLVGMQAREARSG